MQARRAETTVSGCLNHQRIGDGPMDTRTVISLPSAASHDETVRCLLAIELSKKSWVVAVNTPMADKISRYTVEGCDWLGLLKLIDRISRRVVEQLGRAVEVIS